MDAPKGLPINIFRLAPEPRSSLRGGYDEEIREEDYNNVTQAGTSGGHLHDAMQAIGGMGITRLFHLPVRLNDCAWMA